MDRTDTGVAPSPHWRALEDGRIECMVCPRACRLREGQRGACTVRARRGDALVLTTYGRSSGFCVDPIEKKPLYHFLPGSPVLSFGTAGCNLACRFCQNWDISKARETDVLCDAASPAQIARTARRLGCRSVAFTYNDPAVFLEYADDVAAACRVEGIRTVAVTAGYVWGEARKHLFRHIDAANVDLKAFSEDFYRRLCGGRLAPVLDTLRYLREETAVWLEITTLLIPGENDSDAELDELTRWVVADLGADTPLHFSAFHPDWRLRDRPPTPIGTLRRAREIAQANGLHHAYTGNLPDAEGSTTRCAACGAPLISHSGYDLVRYNLDGGGRCGTCGAPCAGVFEGPAGSWGNRRQPVRIGEG